MPTAEQHALFAPRVLLKQGNQLAAEAMSGR
jgi:hypothetical protein